MYKKNAYILTGAPGTGKTTLLKRLADVYETMSEPAREVIADQKMNSGNGLWHKDRKLFIDLLLKKSIENFMNASGPVTFFDRGIPDCIAYADYGEIEIHQIVENARKYQYNKKVFLLEPWEDIYSKDDERTMSFEEIITFHFKIVQAYEKLGYEIIRVPNLGVEERIAVILREIEI